MAISAIQKDGPSITSTTDIKFSDLRKYFLKMNPRTSFSGSPSFEELSGSVSASQLLRTTAVTGDGTVNEYVDIPYRVPAVPNSTENSSISTGNDWKTSQFVGSAKYCYVQQATTDDLNVQIHSLNTSWNGNLALPIRKWFFIDGTVGSTLSGSAAAELNAATNNFSISVSGNVYGASGTGEGFRQTPGAPAGTGVTLQGTNGGDALKINTGGGANVYIILKSSSKVYAGGGGGPRGGSGGIGGQGGATYLIYGMGGVSCNQIGTGNGPPGIPGIHGHGGNGRGYGNISGSLSGAAGYNGLYGTQDSVSAAAAGWDRIYSGKGGKGGNGGAGGAGGNWGQGGNSTGSVAGGRGLKGDDGQGGHRADVGPCAPKGCYSCNDPGTGGGFDPGNNGGAKSTYASVGGKAIRRTTAALSYKLLSTGVDNMIGGEST